MFELPALKHGLGVLMGIPVFEKGAADGKLFLAGIDQIVPQLIFICIFEVDDSGGCTSEIMQGVGNFCFHGDVHVEFEYFSIGFLEEIDPNFIVGG